MSEVKIAAELRTEFGKGAARRIRRADKVPAVLYGHGTDPVHITLPGHDAMLALKTANALIALDIEGRSELALPKHVQRDPLKGFIEHVDLILVRRGEKVVVDVQVVTVGDAAPDTLVVLEHNTLSVETEATHIPTEIEVSIEGAEAGTQIHAKDITLPEGVGLNGDPEALVVNITTAPTEAQLEEAVEGEEAAEGEAAAAEQPAAEAEAPAEA